MPGKMDCYGLTDRGLKRQTNEDHFLIADLNKALRIHQTSLNFDDEETLFGISQGLMLLVADGMGGHAAGEQASRLTVESLTSSMLNCMPWFFSRDAEGDEDLRQALERALDRCQSRLEQEARIHPDVQGMGTTLTAAYVHWPRVTVIHAGDSRCYLLRNGRLKQVTHDHTVAQRLIDAEPTRSQDLLHSRWASVLWNAIGSNGKDVQPEVHQFNLELNDSLLLCTDGLPRHIENPDIEQMLARKTTAKSACEALIAATIARGALDNVTVVMACFVDEDPTSPRMEAIASAEIPSESALDDTSLTDTAPEIPALVEDGVHAN